MQILKIKNSLIAILFFLCWPGAIMTGEARTGKPQANNGEGIKSSVIIYPATPNAVKSDKYAISLNGKNGFVEKMERFDVPYHYTRLAYDGKQPLAIEITASGPIGSYTISPENQKIKAAKKRNRLRFTIQKPGYLVVQIDSLGYLFLLIDSPLSGVPTLGNPGVKNILDYGVDDSGKKLETEKLQKAIDAASAGATGRTLYFPKGEYLTGQLNLKSNVNIYLEPGALIKGSNKLADYSQSLLRFENVENVSISGHGTIDGSGWEGLRKSGGRELYLLFMSGCNNIRIDGPVLRDPCFWNTRVFKSRNIHLRNLKIMNNRPAINWTNTDGVDFDSSTDCDLVNAVMHTGDDNLVVKGLDTSGQYNTERIRFEKIIGLSNSAAAKIGTETCVKFFRDIEFKDVDIILCKRAIVISGFDSSTIENIRFSGIRVEKVVFQGKEGPRIIDIEITDKGWRPSAGLCRVSGISIDDLQVYFPVANVESRILGRTGEFGIKNITIKNFSVMDQLVQSREAGNIITNDFVSGFKLQ
jgi:hypothetical protein